ncbi:PAS domain S-box protein [Siccirubricoccus phaeus]|uniref:PAS domain S-box protein n=1 Tax=Siccirubricoccus phaeus TaxID=2595053 RepID=UPI0011F33EF9|nr:PAS domain S-box protein [Siccirubricoccus phaeus]
MGDLGLVGATGDDEAAAARVRRDLAAAEAANEALRRANAELALSRAALAAREQQLRLALDAARMATWEWQAEGDRLTGSAGREALYGRPPGSLGTLAAVVAAAHPADQAAMTRAIRRAIGRGPEEAAFDAVEFRVVGADGAVRWLRSQGRVTEREPGTGRPLRAAGITFDVTERKRAEQALREAEARYRVLFDSAPFGVIVLDAATLNILDVNTAASEEFGYTPEEFTRLNIADVDALGDVDAIRRRARAHAIRPGTQEFEAQHRLRSGLLRDVLVRVQGIRLGEREVAYRAHFDITGRKAIEANLARLAAILEATPDLVAISDARTGRAVYLNTAYRRLLGLGENTPPEAVQLLACHPPAVAQTLLEEAMPVAARDGSWVGEGLVMAADGRDVPVSLVVLAHHGPGGEVENYSAIMRDLSELKRAEEERTLLARELDHRAKNALAVVQAALRLTPKTDVVSFAQAVEGRVMALARAHTLLARGRWTGASLAALVAAEMAPFAHGRLRTGGPELRLAPTAAQAVSMALHELATNATKYGALSVPDGQLGIGWWQEVAAGTLHLRWSETGGPLVAGPPTQRGFGSRVLEATLRDQLGGTVERHWHQEGLVCDIILPLERALTRGG